MGRRGDAEIKTISPRLRVTPSPCLTSLGFLMICVFAATSTKLGKLQPIGRGLLILGRCVVADLAFPTLEHNVIAWHISISYVRQTLVCRPMSVVRCPLSVVSHFGQLNH